MPVRSPLINVMARAAEKAGRVLVRDFGEVEQLQVSRKGPTDFVTNADTKAEKILMEELGRARPDFGFWTEEAGKVNADRKERFLIDPLDGTLNFLHGIPIWSISIAAEREGEVVAGIIYEPLTDQLFWADKGVGAFVGHQRLRVSSRRDMSEALTGFSMSPRAMQSTDEELIHKLSGQVAGLRRIGSSALNLAYTAAGRFDAYWCKNMNPWDVAAGVLMIREAGGLVTSIEGDANPVYGTTLVASNYHLHKNLVTLARG